MRTLVAIAVLALASATSFAGNATMHLIQPKGSTLAVVAVERESGTSARFSGRTWVSGTFVARWRPGADRKSDAPDALLIPDRNSIPRLPYFSLREPGFAHRYRVREIEIRNGAQALRIVAGEERARRLLDRKEHRVEVVGSFLISGYSVGVECDAPWATAKIEKASVPSRTASVRAQLPDGC